MKYVLWPIIKIYIFFYCCALRHGARRDDAALLAARDAVLNANQWIAEDPWIGGRRQRQWEREDQFWRW